ncbi:MAG: RNA polymerase sigma factor [Bacteroidaceae bacterium]
MTILKGIFKKPTSEEQMTGRLMDGDATAAEQLYHLHARYLTAVCSRYLNNDEDVKDVLQETFIKIFSSIHTFQHKGEGSLRAWMSRIACNESINYLKSTKRLSFSELTEGNSPIYEDEPDVEDIPAEVLQDYIRQLPEGYRVVFNLFVMEGRSHKEIAQMLGIKVNTSASQLYKAKNVLAKKIEQYRRNNHR